MNVNELPGVIATTAQVTQDYATLAANRLAGIYSQPPGTPPLTAAQVASVFEFQKLRLSTGAVVTLFRKLSPASWNGWHGYMVGTYKTTILGRS